MTLTHSWEQGPWTRCSVSCGEAGGQQERSVACVEDDAHGQFSPVDDWKCAHSPRPGTRQKCNAIPCPQWVAMEWSQVRETTGSEPVGGLDQADVYWPTKVDLKPCKYILL